MIPILTSSLIQTYRFLRRELVPLDVPHLWQIESGYLRSFTWDEEGLMITLGFWQAGDLISPVCSGVNPYQIECLTSADLIPVELTVQSGDSQQTLHYLRDQIQQAQELLQIVHSRRVEVRLVKLLNWLAQRFGQPVTQGWLIHPRLTHQDLADVIGATRVTVTRMLSQFEQQGVIHWSRQRQIVLHSSDLHTGAELSGAEPSRAASPSSPGKAANLAEWVRQ